MEFHPGRTVGIDLGTSFSALSALDEDGEPAIVPNSGGETITASVISLVEDGKVSVGKVHRSVEAEPERVITGIKRQMGHRDYRIDFGGRSVTPEFLSALILKKIVGDAEPQLGEIRNAVISVPYYFNDPCRQATFEAGRLAGLNVVDLINEPTAATLAFAWQAGGIGNTESFASERTVLVYDLGGGTFDVTLVRYSPTDFRVVATDGDTFLGGLDWTKRIVDFVSEHYVLKFGVDPREDRRAEFVLTQACEQAKRRLSREESTEIALSHQGEAFDITISRAEFDEMTADLLQRTRDTTELVVEDCGIDPKQITTVLAVGGATFMPAVSRMLRDLTGSLPTRPLNPQHVVAQGAAVHAAILEARSGHADSVVSDAVRRRLRSVSAADVNSHSLGVEVTDSNRPGWSANHIMIPKNSALPAEQVQTFYTTRANPEGIRIRLLEGEASEVDACTVVGDVRIADLPAGLPIGSPVEVKYRYDPSRRIVVSARELTGNREANVSIVWDTSDAAGGDEQDFDAIIEEYHVD